MYESCSLKYQYYINNIVVLQSCLICRFLLWHRLHSNETQQCFENFHAQNGLNHGRISTAPWVSQHGFNIFTVTHHLSEIWVWELTNLAVVRELKGCENLWGFECYIFLAHFMSKYAFSKKELIGITEQVKLIITLEIMQMCEIFLVMIYVNSDSK